MTRCRILFFLLLELWMIPVVQAESAKNIDSLLTCLEKAEGTDRGTLLIKICYQFSYTEPARMKEYARQLVETGRQTGNAGFEIIGYYDLGLSDYLQSNLPEAYQYFTDALKLAEQAKIDSLSIKSLNVMAVIQGRLGHYSNALDNFRKLAALSVARNAYEDYAMALLNMGNCYNILGPADSCEYYYLRSYGLAKEKKIRRPEVYLGKNLAFFYHEKGNYQLAKKYIQEALATSYSVGDNELILGCLNTASLNEKELGHFGDAEKYALQALALADSINAREQQTDALYNLYLLSDKKKDTEKALDYYIRYRELKDSTYNDETQSKILELSAKYESEKKELQINQQQDEIQKSRLRLRFSIVISFFFVVFAGLAVLVFRRRNRMLRDLLRKNIEAMEADKKLREALNVPPYSNIPLIINNEKYKRSTLSVSSREFLEEQFNRIMVEQQLWKQNDITLAKMANLLDTNTKYLSQIINQKYGQSFPNYINELRIKAARCMLVGEEYSNYTIEAIGAEVGFNSNSSFVSAFKKYSGLTPSYFRDSQKTSGV